MAQDATQTVPGAPPGGGSYEVIRARLLAQAKAVGETAESLNARRKELFGGTELSVVGNERVRTENNCLPRDILGVGPYLLFGFDVFLGLRKETAVGDVFALHRFEARGDGFDVDPVPHAEGGGFLADPAFIKDFTELFRYYKDARLLQLRRTETGFIAVFQTGERHTDVRVFRFTVDPSGRATYVDNRGEREHVFPNSHDFEWKTVTREDYVLGRHPHVNILDTIFVDTVKGDLTIKIEDNTEEGQGIYREPVASADQSLDDASFLYAKVGSLILLKILPYRETEWRYLIFNTRTEQVTRIDAIGAACVQLPEDQGLVFPGGYYLQTGDFKRFEGQPAGLEYERMVRSPNGEDVLYVFHTRVVGDYVLFPYNLVRKEMQTPIVCHGYSLFSDGRMAIFRNTGPEPTRVHPIQVWQTPFVSAEFAAQAPPVPGFLGRIGNADLVRGISDALTLRRIAESDKPTRRTFEDVIAGITRAADAYHWLGNQEISLLEPMHALRRSAELIIDEFEKVLALQRRAKEAIAHAETAQLEVLRIARAEHLGSADDFMTALDRLRQQRGHLITLKEIRHVDLERLGVLEQEVVKQTDEVSRACVTFLQDDKALSPTASRLKSLLDRAAPATTTLQLEPLLNELEETSRGLDLLSEVVSGLQVGDPVARARILEGIGELFSGVNRVRATLAARRKELLGHEKRVEFGAQFKLLGQSLESALARVDSPEACDESLGRLSVQLEELEGRFSEFDEFLGQLQERREELFEAFGARKQALLDERQRRAQNVFGAADRILQGVLRRARSFEAEDALNAYFAADAMILKLRQLAAQLVELGDPVRADELESRLKTAREEGLRGLRDRQDLFEGGENVLRLGTHRFSVSTQPLELTVLPREGGLSLNITSTDFSEPIEDPAVLAHASFFDRHLLSESPQVYRSEYLAATILFDAEEQVGPLNLPRLHAAALEPEGLLGVVREAISERYDEGYERGIHDVDAARILEKLLGLHEGSGLLRYPPTARAFACLYWSFQGDPAVREQLAGRGRSLGRLRTVFSRSPALVKLGEELAARIEAFLVGLNIPHEASAARVAGRYLAEELTHEHPRFTTSVAARWLRDRLLGLLDGRGTRSIFEDDLRALEKLLPERLALMRAWLDGLIASEPEAAERAHAVDEAAVLLLTAQTLDRADAGALVSAEVDGLLGTHPRVVQGKLTLRLDEFLERLSHFRHVEVPAYRGYRRALRELLERERRRFRLDEFQPKVLSTFVRNRLIDEVYLPLIGDNLSKQLGTVGENKRTDRMGMLLLISPPGYGKTTLMEYVASRLGLAFVKVNGPALGHAVTSLDPAEAPNATARQEVERINLAFEMGNNVMLYLDDIQHTHPELLQKFISLCDGQRRVEGVWRGRTRTYDLRGKKFAVVMAGNPYNETGERFSIPDMLANRADTYNLGDILNGREELFALSFVENALTSNPALAPLALRDRKDTQLLIRLAQGREESANALEGSLSAVEVQEMVEVLKRLLTVQETLGMVNAEYIASAAQDERFRTEPPFKLQGSYRNMSRIASKVVSAMTGEELEALIDDHYRGESQTLTSSAESNLLKLGELRGRLSPEDAARWADIKRGFARAVRQGGADDDPVTRVTAELSLVGEELGHIREAVTQAATHALAARAEPVAPSGPDTWERVEPRLEQLAQALSALTQAAARMGANSARPPPLPESRRSEAPPAPDLTPYLGRLSEVLQALAQRPVQVEVLGSAPSAEVAAAVPRPQSFIPPALPVQVPEDLGRQLVLLEGMLVPLARLARGHLKDGDGFVRAMQVWTQVSEALELLRTIRPPA